MFDLVRLRREVTPFKVHYFARLGSTSDHAVRLRQRGRLFAPAMVLTSKQTKGRGRGQAVWHSPVGVLTVTFAVGPSPTLPPQVVPLVAGLCVIDVAKAVGVMDVQLKWPNDCWRWSGGEPRKLAGILCERREGLDLIGIGLNVNLEAAVLAGRTRVRAGSLSEVVGELDMTRVVVLLSKAVERRLIRNDSLTVQQVLGEFESVDALLGRGVRVVGDGVEGVARGIDTQGRLRVADRSGVMHRVVSGTIDLFGQSTIIG